MMKNLAQALGTYAAIIEEYLEESRRLRLLAVWAEEDLPWHGLELDVKRPLPKEPRGMALLRIFADRFLKLVENTLATGQSQILEYDLNVPAGQRWWRASFLATRRAPSRARRLSR
jgi:hypothetical protein